MNVIRQTTLARYTVLASFALLLLALVMNQPWAILPLLPFLWGVMQCHWRSHIWLCFVLLFYFLVNINKLAYGATFWLWAECVAIVILFAAAMFYCRWVKLSVPSESSESGPP